MVCTHSEVGPARARHARRAESCVEGQLRFFELDAVLAHFGAEVFTFWVFFGGRKKTIQAKRFQYRKTGFGTSHVQGVFR